MTKEEKEFKNECDEKLYSIYSKIDEEEKIFLSYLVNQFNRICERNNKAIEIAYTIEHNFDKYEEIGTEEHLEYAQMKVKELLEILKGDKENETI